MVLQNVHDIIVRVAENWADSGSRSRRVKRSILVESATVTEQGVRWVLEIELEEEEGGKGGARTTVRIEDRDEDVDVLQSRIEAATHGYMSAEAVRSVAVRCSLDVLLRWLDEGGAQAIDGMMGQRHAHVHSLSHDVPDDVAACRIVEGMIRAALAGRPIIRALFMLVKGVHMEVEGRAGGARAAYETALEDSRAHRGGDGKSNAHALVCAGHALAHLGREGEAEAALWDAIEADEYCHLAYLELGHLALLGGRPAVADERYAKAAGIDPSYAPARVFRGHALLIQDKPGGGREVVQYDGGLALDPYDVSAHVGRGLAMAAQGLHAKAIPHFEEAVRIDPDDGATYVAIGHAQTVLGRYKEAVDAYETAIETESGIGPWGRGAPAGRGVDGVFRLKYKLGGTSAHIGLAGALSRMGMPERALAIYRAAAGIDGGNAEAHAGAARMLAARGQWEAAVPEYRAAIGIDPRDAGSRLGLAVALSNLGRPEEAVPEYRAAIGIDPRDARARRGLAGALSKMGRPEEAVPEYRAAIGIDPRDARARRGLAGALSNLGRAEEAVPEYRAAIAIDPRDARAYLGLAYALSATRMTTEAQRMYERAVELDPGIDKGRYKTHSRWGV